MLVIQVWNSDGPGGQCDARCDNAKGSTCRCCCGGHNHNVGLDKAAADSQGQSGLGLTHPASDIDAELGQWLA